VRAGGGTQGEVTNVLDSVPGPRRRILTRRRISWAGVILVLAAAVAGIAIAALTGDEGPSRRVSEAGAKPIAVEGANDFDPPPGDADEHGDEVRLAIDGSPQTAWTTETYETETLNGKEGVGIYLDAGKPVTATELQVKTETPGFALDVYATADDPPDDLAGWGESVATAAAVTKDESIPLEAPAPARYYLLWITAPAETEGGFGAEIADVRLLG